MSDYTREQILAMESGWDLNVLVAEKVIEHVAWEERRGAFLYVTFYGKGVEPYRRHRNWEKEKERYRIIPFSEIDPMKQSIHGLLDYSCDITAAWEVVEKNISPFFQLTASNYHEKIRWHCSFSAVDSVEAPAAPEAICKAALLAVLGL